MGGFANVLRELREKAGLSQEQLARRANVTLNTINKLENQRAQPSWATVRKLAMALGVSCQAFEREGDASFGGTEAPPAKPRKRRKGE
jgi:transcriptional regulator with XRE-family HTH domain